MDREEIAAKLVKISMINYDDCPISEYNEIMEEYIDEFTEAFRLLELFHQFFMDVQDICLEHNLMNFHERIFQLVQGVREEV